MRGGGVESEYEHGEGRRMEVYGIGYTQPIVGMKSALEEDDTEDAREDDDGPSQHLVHRGKRVQQSYSCVEG